MFEQLLAGLVLIVCLVMLVRLALPARRRWAFDAAWHRSTQGLRANCRYWWTRMRRSRSAAREADAVIHRARKGKWDGNVYRPDSFRGPRKPH